MVKTIKTFFLAARPQFLPGTMIPAGIGASAAWKDGFGFDPILFILTLLAVGLYHSGMNVLNDYFDFKNGTDNINKNAQTPFTGGSRFIQRGLISPAGTLAFGLVLLGAGSLIGVYLAFKAAPLLFLIGAFGLFTGFFYSAPPLFLAGRGLGELAVAVNFGLLTVIGSYAVQSGNIMGANPVFSSLPISFLIAALLYINEFPDCEADRAVGKRTLVVRLGPETARFGLAVLSVLAWASIIAGVLLGYTPGLSLAALLSVIFLAPAIRGLLRHYNEPARLVPSIKKVIGAHIATGVLLIASNLF